MDFAKLEVALVSNFGTQRDISDRIFFERKVLHVLSATSFVLTFLHKLHEIDLGDVKPKLSFIGDYGFDDDFEVNLCFIDKNGDIIEYNRNKKKPNDFFVKNAKAIESLEKFVTTPTNMDYWVFIDKRKQTSVISLTNNKQENYQILFDNLLPREYGQLANKVFLESELSVKESPKKIRPKI